MEYLSIKDDFGIAVPAPYVNHGEENVPKNNSLFTEWTFWTVSNFNTLDLVENKLVFSKKR